MIYNRGSWRVINLLRRSIPNKLGKCVMKIGDTHHLPEDNLQPIINSRKIHNHRLDLLMEEEDLLY